MSGIGRRPAGATALIPEGLEPLAVWDAGSITDFSPEQHVETGRWHERHIGRANDTYRVEFYLVDAPLAVAYRYKRNGDGFKYQDPETGEAATEEPVIVPLGELPPARLLGGRQT